MNRDLLFPKELFAKRRATLAKAMLPGSALVVPATPMYTRNHDVHHAYRPDSNLFYLTGFTEPDSIFVFYPDGHPQSILLVRERDPERELWDGFRYGVEGTAALFGVDLVLPIGSFADELPSRLKSVRALYYAHQGGSLWDRYFQDLCDEIKYHRGRSGEGYPDVLDFYPLVGELRLYKDEYELAAMRKSAEISSFAHQAVMKRCRPGVNERELYGVFLERIMALGAAREAYNGIFASGPNACVLHYTFNDRHIQDGDMVLVDAGGEYQMYASDITRTFPANGRFTAVQKRVYGRLLDIQKYLIKLVQPGAVFSDLQKTAIELLTDLMIEEGLLQGSRDVLIKDLAFRRYYPHNLGHNLGLDVHDAGLKQINQKDRQLGAGMVVTIEPGLYVPANDEAAPRELRGMGIRIEDDVLVAMTGLPEVLSKNCPKEIDELESLIGQ